METHPDDGEVWERAVGAASVALPARYRPRSPEATLLHRVVRADLEPFLADARERSEHGFLRALSTHQRQRAREAGVDVSAKGGAVTFVQRFNSALGLNIHCHVVGRSLKSRPRRGGGRTTSVPSPS